MKFRILEYDKNKMQIPPDVQTLTDIMESKGYKLYPVGGCIRDSLMGKVPKDWDLSTNAKPEEVVKIMEAESLKVIPTGLKHGTVTVLLNDEPYEITTFRADKNTGEGHKEVDVEFVDSLEEDLSRRDLTINAMAWDVQNDKLIDPFNGSDDLQNGLIRTVGNPDERFVGDIDGDPLRLLRAVRFAARLNFEIDDATLESMKKNADSIKSVSSERVKLELEGILMSDNPDYGFKVLQDVGLLQNTLPEVSDLAQVGQNTRHHVYDVFEHTLKALKSSYKSPSVRWAMLFHDLGKPSTKTTDDEGVDHFYEHSDESEKVALDIMKRLKFDNKMKNRVATIVKHHQLDINPKKRVKAKNKIRDIVKSRAEWERKYKDADESGFEEEYYETVLDDIFHARDADAAGQNPDYHDEKIASNVEMRKLYKDIIGSGEPLYVSDLDINGKDVINIVRELEPEFKGGPIMKGIMDELLRLVLNEPILNNKERLSTYVPRIYKRLE